MRWLVLSFVIVPLVEFALLLVLGEWLGLAATITMVVATGLLGGTLARAEGFKVWREWQRDWSMMRAPAQSTAQGLLVLIGGLLLITPGVLTDLAGLLCVLPQTRRPLARILVARFTSSLPMPRGGTGWPPDDGLSHSDTIETTGTSTDDPKR